MFASELWRDVLAAPDDDDARMVFADALAEGGDPRGELVHVQLALAAGHGDRDALEDRRDELLDEHGGAWLAPLERAFGTAVEVLAWQRGFPTTLRLDATALERGLDALVEHVPDPQLVVDGFERDLALRLAQRPELARVRRLRLLGTPSDYAPLLASLHLVGLRTLELTRDSAQILDAIVKAPALAELERLALADFDGASLGRLLANGALPKLRSLSVTGGRLTDALAPIRARPMLRELRLHSCRLLDDDVAKLARAELPELATLVLVGARIDNHGATALANAPKLPALRELVLAGARLPPAALGALVASSALEDLRMFGIHLADGATDAQLARALDRWQFRALEFAALHNAELGPLAAASLGARRTLAGLDLHSSRVAVGALVARGLSQLRILDLALTSASDADATALATAHLPQLRRLGLGGTRIGRPGAVALGATHLERLDEVAFCSTLPQNGAETALVGSPLAQRLRRLELDGSAASDADLRLLAQRGAPKLRHLGLLSTRVSVDGLLALDADTLGALRSINGEWTVDAAQLRKLVAAPGLRNVRELRLCVPPSLLDTARTRFGKRVRANPPPPR